MKIAHTGDIHWGLNYPGPTPQSRFNDVTRTMDWVANAIIEEECDLVLVAGDAFKDARVFIDRASVEIKAFADWLRKLTDAGIQVIVISGTPSHDAIAAYELVKEMRIPGVTIATQPEVFHFETANHAVDVACLPGLNRSNIVSNEEYRSLQPHQIHQIMTEKITQICKGLLAQCDYQPSILLSHMTYIDANKGFEDLIKQHEPLLTKEAVDGFDFVALGHIHRPQNKEKAFYCGSPERLSFNDEDVDTGFWIHEVGKENIDSYFIETPSREYLTLNLDEGWMKEIVNDPYREIALGPWILRDKILRLHYSCSEDIARQIDRKVLEKALYDAGAFFVSEIKADVQRNDRVRDREVNESITPVEAVGRWGANQKIDASEIYELQALTNELLEEVAS